MKNNIINLAFITDAKYAPITLVAIYSAIENKAPSSKYQINILCVDVPEKQLNDLKKLETKNVNINIIKKSEKYNRVNNNYYVTPTALFKFDLPEILNKLSKVLYLDSDVIVQEDLSSLYNTDLTGYCAGVVFHNYWKDNERLGLTNYFNSGVLLLNLSKLRKENYYEKLINEKFQNKSLKYMDNDVFNVVFAENVVSLPQKYNYLNIYNFYTCDTPPHESTSNICVLHYASYPKPWEFRDGKNAKIWHHYLKKLRSTKKYKYTMKKIKEFTKPKTQTPIFKKLLHCLFYKNNNNKKKFRLFGIPLFSLKRKTGKKVIKILGIKFALKGKGDKMGG